MNLVEVGFLAKMKQGAILINTTRGEILNQAESLARTMVATGAPVMIGALTPSEIVLANKLGADVVIILPGSLGGPDYLKALRGPFPLIKMMPTGGVSKANARDWFAAGACAVGAGSELCPPAWAKEGRFADPTRNVGEFALAVKKARMK